MFPLLGVLTLFKSLAGALLLSAFVLLFSRSSGKVSTPWQRWNRLSHEAVRLADRQPLWLPETVDHYELKGEEECQK